MIVKRRRKLKTNLLDLNIELQNLKSSYRTRILKSIIAIRTYIDKIRDYIKILKNRKKDRYEKSLDYNKNIIKDDNLSINYSKLEEH